MKPKYHVTIRNYKTVRVLSFIFLWSTGVFMQFFSRNFGVFASKRFKPKIFVNFGADSIASIKVHNFFNLGCTVSDNILDFHIINIWVLEKLRQRNA